MPHDSKARRSMTMSALIVAGEAVFLLPFVIARIFRPTFLDVFGLTNFELGAAFSLYGLVAMGSYFLGGPLADRYSARRLMAAALLATALGGGVMASIPSLGVLTMLYGFWGLTSILLFWAALIRATREWGGEDGQGRAYGILDGGRGLFAALIGSVSVAVFAFLLPSEVITASLAERSSALGNIIWIHTGLIVCIAVWVWTVVPESPSLRANARGFKSDLAGVRTVLKMPTVLLQAVIVVCAYVGYKATDDFSLFARDAFGYDDVQAATVGTISFWIRPIAAVGAGLIADRIGTSRATWIGFAILLAGSVMLASGMMRPGLDLVFFMTVAGASVGIYALRGIYFALFGEGKVPLGLTGTAVGVVSVIGYTPDVFSGPLMGFLLDRSPGALGHQHVFAVVAGFAVVGGVAALLFGRLAGREGAGG